MPGLLYCDIAVEAGNTEIRTGGLDALHREVVEVIGIEAVAAHAEIVHQVGCNGVGVADGVVGRWSPAECWH